MKTLNFVLLTFCLFVGNVLLAQPHNDTDQMSFRIVYRGYPNVIALNLPDVDPDKIEIKGFLCDITKTSGDYWILETETEEASAYVEIYTVDKRKKELFQEVEFIVEDLPNPELFWASSQKGNSEETPNIAIELPEVSILFRAYKNEVKVVVDGLKKGQYTVHGVNCTFTLKEGTSNTYIVLPGRGKTASIKVSTLDANGYGTVLYEKNFRVFNLPDPKLYWGRKASGSIADINARTVTVRYPYGFALESDFTIVRWSMTTEDGTCSGDSTDLSNADSLLQIINVHTKVSITADVKGPDGITRKLGGEWSVQAMKGEEE